jgi:hypothetical protein
VGRRVLSRRQVVRGEVQSLGRPLGGGGVTDIRGPLVMKTSSENDLKSLDDSADLWMSL